MALPDDFQTRLENEGIAGDGTDWKITADTFPPSPDRAVAIVLSPGAEPHHMGPTDEVPVQIKTRAEKGAGRAAFDKLVDIFKSLHKFTGTMNGVEYGGIFTLTKPSFLRVDDKERHIYVANFRALRQGPR